MYRACAADRMDAPALQGDVQDEIEFLKKHIMNMIFLFAL